MAETTATATAGFDALLNLLDKYIHFSGGRVEKKYVFFTVSSITCFISFISCLLTLTHISLCFFRRLKLVESL
jgi:hypothetical protein